MNVRRESKGQVLRAGTGDETVSAIEAMLDTGASGMMLATQTVEALKIERAKTKDGQEITFEDVGVAGAETFAVTEPLFVSVSGYSSNSSGEQLGAYDAPIGPMRMQIRPRGGILELIAPGLDIAGMPVMEGKVVVIDPRPLAQMDLLRTEIFSPKDSRIPKTSLRVPLTYVNFGQFTRTNPPGAEGAIVAKNPMIGPDPFDPSDKRKSVIIRHNGKESKGTFLLDTGAAASMISTRVAKDLGIEVDASGAIQNAKADFQLPIGGLGGSKNVSGIFFDEFAIPTTTSRPILFAKAPLLITDITVEDAQGKQYTLDGILGMNFLVASVEITGGLIPDIGEIKDGAFQMIVIDNAKGELGLEPR